MEKIEIISKKVENSFDSAQDQGIQDTAQRISNTEGEKVLR